MEDREKTAMVTGASVGIGRAAALTFARKGMNVVISDVNEEKLLSVKKEIESLGASCLACLCDVSDVAQVEEMTARTLETFGRIDILVNNAALWRHSALFEDIPDEIWSRFLSINIMGVVYCTRAVIRTMKKQKYGRIINVASVAGIYGNRLMSCYSMTKAAIIALTKSLAKEVCKDGIVVNAISPGTVSPSSNDDVNFTEPNSMPYMERTGSDQENANLIAFLASDEAPYLNGQNIEISGVRHLL